MLILEDDPAGSYLLCEILSHTQIEIRLVENGIEAVEACKTDPDIDIVLLDMQVPALSGIEAARKICTLRKDLPIIAQSAFVMTEDKDRAMEAGCTVHISKPINTFELLGTMHQLLHKTDSLPI